MVMFLIDMVENGLVYDEVRPAGVPYQSERMEL